MMKFKKLRFADMTVKPIPPQQPMPEPPQQPNPPIDWPPVPFGD